MTGLISPDIFMSMKKNPVSSTIDWQAVDSSHHLHPFTDTKTLAEEGCRVITRADGVYIWDSDGNRLLDGMAGLWCVNVGYGRKELAEAAYQQLLELPYYNSFSRLPRQRQLNWPDCWRRSQRRI